MAPTTDNCTPTKRFAVTAVAGDVFRSLRVRNFRLWFVGQFISMTGYMMGVVAQALLVLHLTNNGSLLGIALSLQFAPILFLGPAAGLVCDRVDKRKLLLGTQSSMMVIALILGALVLTHHIRLWSVFLLGGLSGIAWCLDQPARNTIVLDLVSQDDSANAFSLNAAINQGSKVTGPALGGVVVTTLGTGWCFVINGVTSIAVLTALVLMDRTQIHRTYAVQRLPGQVRAGLRYAWEHVGMRCILGLLAVAALTAMQWNVLLPLFAIRELHGDSGTYTLLMAVMSVGCVLGTLWLARHRTVGIQMVVTTCFGLAAALLLVALSPSVLLAAASIFIFGFFTMVFVNGGAVVLQLSAQPQMRGRIMAVYTMVTAGVNAAGAPITGAVAQHFGTRAAFLAGVVATAAAALVVRMVAVRSDVSAPVVGTTAPAIATTGD